MTGAPDAAAPLTGKHSAAGRLRAVTLWAWALDCIRGKEVVDTSSPCPHPHRRNSSNSKIDSREFWRPDHQLEYTFTQPLGCLNYRGHHNGSRDVQRSQLSEMHHTMGRSFVVCGRRSTERLIALSQVTLDSGWPCRHNPTPWPRSSPRSSNFNGAFRMKRVALGSCSSAAGRMALVAPNAAGRGPAC